MPLIYDRLLHKNIALAKLLIECNRCKAFFLPNIKSHELCNECYAYTHPTVFQVAKESLVKLTKKAKKKQRKQKKGKKKCN